MATKDHTRRTITDPRVSIISKNGRWRARFRLSSKHYSLEIDPATNGDVRRTAMALAAESQRIGRLLGHLKRGEHVLNGQTLWGYLDLPEPARQSSCNGKAGNGEVTFGVLCDLKVAELRTNSQAREKGLNIEVNRVEELRDRFGSRPADEITTLEIDQYLDERKTRGRRCVRSANALGAVWNEAKKQIGQNGGTTANKIARAIERRKQTVQTHVEKLLAAGSLDTDGRGTRRRLVLGDRNDNPVARLHGHLTNDTVNRFRRLLVSIYDLGAQKGLVKKNPAKGATRRRKHKAEQRPPFRTAATIQDYLRRTPGLSPERMNAVRRCRVLEEDEQRRLLGLAREKDPELVPPLIVGLHGVSPIDLRIMPPSAFDAQERLVRWCRLKGTTEDAIDYEVPIHDVLASELARHVEALPPKERCMFPLFHHTADGKPVGDAKDRMIRLLARLVADTEFQGPTWHSLRHSFISTCLHNNLPIEVVGGWCGHLSTETTRRYGHFLPAKSREYRAHLKWFDS